MVGEALASPGEAFSQNGEALGRPKLKWGGPGEAFSKNGLPWGGLSVKIARCTVGVKSYDLLASGYYNNMI